METVNEETIKEPNHNRGGRALGGLVVLIAGVIWLLERMHIFSSPDWLFTWPMFLIVLGLYIGARHGFRSWGGWLILMLVGGYFLTRDYFPEYAISDYMWPIAIIVFGIFLILRPKHRYDLADMHYRHHQRHWKKWEKWQDAANASAAPGEEWKKWHNTSNINYSSGEDYIDSTSIFGETRKTVLSKNFKGGDIVNIFGGCEINLTQADFTGTIKLEVTQVFGGAKIIVPTDWRIQTATMTSVFGGVEDKRPPSIIKENPEKTLIISGTSIFAGIDIQCY